MKFFYSFLFLHLFIYQSAFSQFKLYQENNKVGLRDSKGNVVIPARYDALGWSDGTFSIIDKVTGYALNGQWGLINLDNKIITKTDFTSVVPGEALMLVAQKKPNYSARNVSGCILTSGKEIIPFEYDGLKLASFRVIAFKRISNQLKFGLLDLTNKKIIPMEYKSIYSIGSLRFAVENFQNKTALFSETGKQITDFVIDSISAFHKNFAIIHQHFKEGLIDRDGQIKIEPKFSAIQVQNDGTIKARPPDEWDVLNEKNVLLQKVEGDSIEGIDKNVFKLKIAGNFQLVDAAFKPITTQTFASLQKFKNGKAVFGNGYGYGIIRKNGAIVVEPVYNQIIAGNNYYLANECKEGKDQWVILDTLGHKKHTKHYDRIFPYNGKFFPARNKNFWGAVDQQGKEIIACVHDSLLQSLNTHVVVKFHGQYGVIDLKENWIVPPQPFKITLLSNDRYLLKTNRTTFLKSFNGNIIYFTDNKLKIFSNYLQEHLASGGLWEIDLNGRILTRQLETPERIEKILPESEGLKAIKKDGKFGFIDARGRLRIANRYEDVQRFSQQLAAIKIQDKWGFINHEDKIAIQPVYDEVTPFKNDVSIVKQGNYFGAVNTSGKVVLPLRYTNLNLLPGGRIRLNQNGMIGLADTNGNLIINCKYSRVEDLDNGYVIVSKDDRYSLLDLQGMSIIPMIYDYISYDPLNNRYFALHKSNWTIVDVK